MTKDFYDVSLSPPGEGDWDEPVSVLAVSPERAAEERLKEAATLCDDWLGSEWDSHVTRRVGIFEFNWYYRLARPRLAVVVESCVQYFPEGTKEVGDE